MKSKTPNNDILDHKRKIKLKRLRSIVLKIFPILREVLPLIIEKYNEIQGKPTLKKLYEENEQLKNRIKNLEFKMKLFLIFVILQTIFIIFFIVFFIIKQ